MPPRTTRQTALAAGVTIGLLILNPPIRQHNNIMCYKMQIVHGLALQSPAAGLLYAPARSAYKAGRGALLRDRRRTSGKGEHGPCGNHRYRITEPEKTVLRRAAPVARESAPYRLQCDSKPVAREERQSLR